MKAAPRLLRIARLLGHSLALAVAARAQTTWTSTSSGQWGTAGNWSSGVPTSGSTATFNSSSGLAKAIILVPSASAASLSFGSAGGANAFTFDTAATLNSNTLTLYSGINNSDTAGITFFNAAVLAGTQSWSNSGGTLTFDGSLRLADSVSGYTLSLNGSGSTTLAGVVSDGGVGAAGSIVQVRNRHPYPCGREHLHRGHHGQQRHRQRAECERPRDRGGQRPVGRHPPAPGVRLEHRQRDSAERQRGRPPTPSAWAPSTAFPGRTRSAERSPSTGRPSSTPTPAPFRSRPAASPAPGPA